MVDDNIDKDNLKCLKCGRPIYYTLRLSLTSFTSLRHWLQCKECNQKFFDTLGINKYAERADLK